MTRILLAIIYPERFRWYRRWRGGKWSYWNVIEGIYGSYASESDELMIGALKARP
jgi:hypothetical protein